VRIARPWSVQRRNGDDAAIAQAMEYGRRGTGGVGPLSSELERGSQPATERRYSKAFKRGMYTVDERVPQCAWYQGIGQTPCTRL
jgi:hypothetical protein